MTTTTIRAGGPRRLDVPALEWRTPPCPACDRDTDCDGNTYWCEACGLTWDGDYDSPGRPADEDAPQCSAMIAPYTESRSDALRSRWYRCVLDDGHEDDTGASTEHYGLRSDLDPWGPDHRDDYRWRDEGVPYGRRRVVPVPAQGPTVPPTHPYRGPGPVVALPPRVISPAVSPAFL